MATVALVLLIKESFVSASLIHEQLRQHDEKSNDNL